MRGRELLSKYISSGLSNDERFELEKLALDDDFLADAWEGLSSKESKNAQQILAILDERLSSLHPVAKVVPIYKKLWPYAVAASLALVLSVGILLKSEQGHDTGIMASVVAEQEVTEKMADASIQDESTEEEDVAETDDPISPKVEEKVTVSKKTMVELPAPDVVTEERSDVSSSFASAGYEVQQKNTAGHKIIANAQINSDGANSPNRSIRTSKESLLEKSSDANTINLKRRASQTSNSDVLVGRLIESENSQQGNVAILKGEARSNDPILNGLSKEKLQSIPPKERSVPIPNTEEVVTNTSADGRILKPLELKREMATLDTEVGDMTLIETDQSIDIRDFIALQDSVTIITSTEDDSFVAVLDNADSGLSASAISHSALTLAPEFADACAAAKAIYKTDYTLSPSPERAREIYNLLKENGCPTDGTDSFMTELRLEYENWAAQQNTKKAVAFDSIEPTQNYKSISEFEDRITINWDNASNEKDPRKKAELYLENASLFFRGLKNHERGKEQALKALEIDSKLGKALMILGDMYASTARSCGDDWNQRLAILAAYDKYEEAKTIDPSSESEASSKMNKYRSSFPLKDTGFMRGVKAGDEQRVGCWIDEVVKVRYRN